MQKMTANHVNTRHLVWGGLLVALAVVMGFYNVYLPPNGSRLTFRFIPLLYGSIVLGPFMGACIGGVADLLTYVMTPGSPGAFFPGFTITAILMGLFPGFLIKKGSDATITKLVIVCFVSFLLTWVLDSLWLRILIGKGYLYYLVVRAVPNLIQAAISVPILWTLIRRLPLNDARK